MTHPQTHTYLGLLENRLDFGEHYFKRLFSLRKFSRVTVQLVGACQLKSSVSAQGSHFKQQTTTEQLHKKTFLRTDQKVKKKLPIFLQKTFITEHFNHHIRQYYRMVGFSCPITNVNRVGFLFTLNHTLLAMFSSNHRYAANSQNIESSQRQENFPANSEIHLGSKKTNSRRVVVIKEAKRPKTLIPLVVRNPN